MCRSGWVRISGKVSGMGIFQYLRRSCSVLPLLIRDLRARHIDRRRRVLASLLMAAAIASASGAAGELDPSFNAVGFTCTRFEDAADAGNAVAAQADGKVVVVGAAGDHFGVARYNTDGSLDPSFGSGGKVITNFGTFKSVATAVRVQPNDGKIVVAGYASGLVGFSESPMAVARYNPDGSLDASFDGDGRVTTALDQNQDRAFALVILSDGRIVVRGYSADFNLKQKAALVRYQPDGSLDLTFDGDGKVVTTLSPGNDRIHALAIYGEQIFAAGYALIGSSNAFAVMRYHANGSLDTNFNTTGVVFPAMGTDAVAHAIAIQPGNNTAFQTDTVVVAGYGRNSARYDFAVARFNLNGSLDTTFDQDGKVTTPIAADNYGRSVIVQGQLNQPRKIVVGGYSRDGSSFRFFRRAIPGQRRAGYYVRRRRQVSSARRRRLEFCARPDCFERRQICPRGFERSLISVCCA